MHDFADYANLYQKYRINAAVITFMNRAPFMNVPNVTSGTTNNYYTLPQLHWHIDTVNTIAPTSVESMQSHSYYHVKTLRPGTPVSIKVKPKYGVEVHGTVSNIWPKASTGWLDTSHTEIPHYGIKLGIDNMLLGSHLDVIVRIKYYISFKILK